jgi:hypothetical protein
MSHKLTIEIQDDVWDALCRISSIFQSPISEIADKYLAKRVGMYSKLFIKALYDELHKEVNMEFPEILKIIEENG